MNILIYQCLGSEIKLNDAMPLAEQQQKYELTQDNFIRNVRWFIRNEEGDVLMVHDTRYNRRSVPGGKVDKGQTLDQALEIEIGEELGVKIISKTYIWGRKCYMRWSKWLNTWMAHYYDIRISGSPHNKESDKAEEIAFLKLHYDHNQHLSQVDALWKSYTWPDIYDKFPGLHTLVDVLPHMPQTPTESESDPFSLPDNIDLEKTYQQWYNTEKREYYIKEI